jgi:hypothetical protein
MSKTSDKLEELCASHKKFLRKGGLCVGLVITQVARDKGLPLVPESLRTEEEGQVAGLGKASVQRILEADGITQVLAEEGGRTSRGSLGLMTSYVALLNDLYGEGALDLVEAHRWWVNKVRLYFASEGPKFHFDPGKSLHANIQDLIKQATKLQEAAHGTNYVGAMLQHLVGAKLDLVLGGNLRHHGFSVADTSTGRQADFEIQTVAIHVTTHPTEALIRKCAENLQAGLKPLIITIGDAVKAAEFLLQNPQLSDRVDVLDAGQFLTANIYERSLFNAAECKITLTSLIERYNTIIASCENDPLLVIKFRSLGSKSAGK